MKYYGIEGSEFETEKLKSDFVDGNTIIECGDFLRGIPFDVSFDLIFDRGAVVCNDEEGVELTLRNAYEKLTRGIISA